MKTKLYGVVIAVGILSLLDFVLVVAKGNTLHIGTISLLIIGILCILLGYLKIFKKVQIIKNKYLSRTIIICFALFLCSFVTIESLMWASAKDESNQTVDFVILLGAGLQGDKITVTFKNRIDECAAYLESHPNTKVVVTGGQGIGETITEAEAMERYLVEKGISEDRIYQEDQATSTFENLEFSKVIIDASFSQKDYTIIIATNDFHLLRAKMLAKRLGLEAYGMPAKTWWAAYPGNCIREYFAVIKSYVVDR